MTDRQKTGGEALLVMDVQRSIVDRIADGEGYKDYQLTVIADCCADADAEVHRVLTTKIFPRQAQVVNAQQSTGSD